MKILNDITLGVQSWCLRDFKKTEDMLSKVKECGLDAVEICGTHVDFKNPCMVDEVIAKCKKEGVTITSCGINGFPNDEGKIRCFFDFARKAGFNTLGASPEPDSYELLDKLCREYGMKIAIHNHGREDIKYGTIRQLEKAFEVCTGNIGLCLDTAWLLEVGDNPVEAVYKFKDRLLGIHFKDFSFDQNRNAHETIYGEGALDIHSLYKALKDIGFKGYASIEFEKEPENPCASIRKCSANLLESAQF